MKIFKRVIILLFLTIIALLAARLIITPSEQQKLLPFEEKSIVDFHVHVAGLGLRGSGCFINQQMKDNFRFNFYLRALGVSLEELESQGDQVLFKKLDRSVSESRVIGQVVVLAMDGVVDRESGELDVDATQIYIPNEFVFEQTSTRDSMLFGASINPYHPDAVERLERAYQQGAVLIKWIPSIMYIDPADTSITDFYLKMVELDIPLLSHTGMEKSFSGARDELADPLKLSLPLELGVTVIAAHIATTGKSELQDNFERILPMFEQYDNLYTDISSLTQLNKLDYLEKALHTEGLTDRFIFGTDWPLQFFPLVSPWYHIDQISAADAKAIDGLENQWDKDVALKHAMGVPTESFYRGKKLFIR